MRGLRIAAMLALSLTPSAALAQKAFSVEAGFLTAFEDAAVLVGIRTMSAKPGGAGVDFSLHTLPQVFSEGLVLMPNLDLTSSVSVGPRAWLLPRIGLSALIGVSGGGGGGVFGLNVGIGLLGRSAEHAGLRLDATYGRYFGGGDSIGFTSLTCGFAWVK